MIPSTHIFFWVKSTTSVLSTSLVTMMSLYQSPYRRPTIYLGGVKVKTPKSGSLGFISQTSTTTVRYCHTPPTSRLCDHSTYSLCSLCQSSSDSFQLWLVNCRCECVQQLWPAPQGYLCKCNRGLTWTEPADYTAYQVSLHSQSIAEYCEQKCRSDDARFSCGATTAQHGVISPVSVSQLLGIYDGLCV